MLRAPTPILMTCGGSGNWLADATHLPGRDDFRGLKGVTAIAIPGSMLFASPRNDGNPSQRKRPVFPVGEARFLEIEVALDPAPDFVGDLAVAQHRVDELAFHRDQLPRELGSERR